MPQIVGGLADGTSGTLTAPDLDLNMEWHLGDEVMEHLEALVLDDAASGQYRLKVIQIYNYYIIINAIRPNKGNNTSFNKICFPCWMK